MPLQSHDYISKPIKAMNLTKSNTHKNKCVARQNRKINKSSADIYMSVDLDARVYSVWFKWYKRILNSTFSPFFWGQIIEISQRSNWIKSRIKLWMYSFFFCYIPSDKHRFFDFFSYTLSEIEEFRGFVRQTSRGN